VFNSTKASPGVTTSSSRCRGRPLEHQRLFTAAIRDSLDNIVGRILASGGKPCVKTVSPVLLQSTDRHVRDARDTILAPAHRKYLGALITKAKVRKLIPGQDNVRKRISAVDKARKLIPDKDRELSHRQRLQTTALAQSTTRTTRSTSASLPRRASQRLRITRQDGCPDFNGPLVRMNTTRVVMLFIDGGASVFK
jgi:hypothetical protein